MKKPFLAAGIFTLLSAAASFAQINTDFQITKIDPSLEKTPQYNLTIGPQRRADSQNWLMVEVEFAYQPRNRNIPEFLDELSFNYYILLANDPKKPTLLTGTITHTAITASKGMHSVAFVSPRTLQRFFGGKIPTNASTATIAIGVTISVQGQLVAEQSIGKGKGQQNWWNQFQQTSGYVLNKDETPFAPLFWDYYEALKAKPGN